jgi:hypothetical protein
MYHHMEFDPYLIRERNQQLFRKVQALCLEKRLRGIHKAHGSRLVAFALRLKSTLHMLRRVGLAELRPQGGEGAFRANSHTGHKDERFEREEYR